eukprot:3995455-Alexandrium_andersonii.AAC.1
MFMLMGTGSCQGGSIADKLFMKPHRNAIDKWQGETKDMPGIVPLQCRGPVYRSRVDATLSTYVDDVARLYLCADLEQFSSRTWELSDTLDEALDTIRVKQNQGKAETVPAFVGR